MTGVMLSEQAAAEREKRLQLELRWNPLVIAFRKVLQQGVAAKLYTPEMVQQRFSKLTGETF